MIDETLLDKTFAWNTGTAGTVIGYAEDVSKEGNQARRTVLFFRSLRGGLFCYPYELFLKHLRPSYEPLIITGSGYPVAIYHYKGNDHEHPYRLATESDQDVAEVPTNGVGTAPAKR